MKISVIIPTYNRATFMLDAIASVRAQSIHVDEIIVVDDGSIDDTKTLLEHKNIKYIYQDNKGVSSARNTGIKQAKNEWIAFLDSDDIWCENKLEHHVRMHQNNPSLLASYTDEIWVRDGKIIKLKAYQKKEAPTFLNSLRLCKIGASTFFCHKKLFEDIGFFDEHLQVCEDYDLWLRILKKYEIKLIDKKLTTKNAGHDNQLSFDTTFIDTYRIKALEKHILSHFKSDVLDELIYKVSILQKGALKHNNIKMIQYCEKKLNHYISLKT